MSYEGTREAVKQVLLPELDGGGKRRAETLLVRQR